MFSLLLRTTNEVIDRTSANNIEEAREFFRLRKQMKPKAFDSIYMVEADAK